MSEPGGPDEAPTTAGLAAGRRGSFLVASGILLSRLAGLIREIFVSGYLGTTAAADAFKAALRIPNLLQNLLGEGVLSASFIPVYARLVDEDKEEAGRLAGAVAGLLCALVALLVVLGMLLARPLTLLLTPGFDEARVDLAVDLLRIMFPGIGALVLSAWCLGVLNSHRRFFLSYVAPVLWSAAQVAAIVTAALFGASLAGLATALSWGVVAGGALQLAVQLRAVRALLGRIRLSLDTGMASLREVVGRFVPVVMGRGVVQLVGYLDLVLASLLAVGAVSAMAYAQVLYLLPISLFGMAVAAAELPELSRLGKAGRAAVRERLIGGMDRVTFYVGFTAAMYLVAGDVLVRLLLQRGEFGMDDTRLVWFTLGAFSLGLLATTRSRLLQNGLYALDRSGIVARIAVLRVVLSAGIGALLMFPLDRVAIVGAELHLHEGFWGQLPDAVRLLPDGPARLGIVGLAIGAAISSWVEYGLLRGALRWRVGRLPRAGPAGRRALVAAMAAAVLAAGLRVATSDLPAPVAAALTFGLAGGAYLAICHAFAVEEARVLLRRVRVPGR